MKAGQASGDTSVSSGEERPRPLAKVLAAMRRPLPFPGWPRLLTGWAVLLAAVTFREVQVIRGGGESFFSYVRIGGMLFVCVIGALVWLIETTKPSDPADPKSSSNSAATMQEPGAR